MQHTWRPMMAYLYMLICFTDFALFPILWTIIQTVTGATSITQWQPLTLQSAGLFHFAMGAVLGISAYGRSQEKLANMASNFVNHSSTNYPTQRADPYQTNTLGSSPDQFTSNNQLDFEQPVSPKAKRKSYSAKPIQTQE